MDINYNLNTPQKEESLIMLICYYQGNRFKRSTGISVKTKQWSKKKGNALSSNGYSEAKMINSKLAFIQRKFHEAIEELYNKGEKLTNNSIRKALDSKLNDTVTPDKTTKLSEYLKIFDEQKSKESICKSTLQTYSTAIEHIKDWLKDKEVYFSDLELNDYNSFANYLYDKGLKDRSVIKNLKKLSAIVKHAIKNKNTDAKINPFSLKEMNLKKPPSDKVFLTNEEIENLANMDLNCKFLEGARDVFVILCYTGLRFGNLPKITKDSILEKKEGKRELPILSISISKGGEKIAVPLNETAQRILKKYDYDLPEFSNQKLNKLIKEVCKLAELDELENIRTWVRKVSTDNYSPKYQLVGSHTGRRSFVTNALNKGLSYDQVMKMTGHKKIETLQEYNRNTAMDNAEMLSKHEHFNPQTTKPSTP